MGEPTNRFMVPKVALIIIAVVFLFSCATHPPTKAIQELNSIAGKWEGTIYYSGRSDPFTLIIGKDGTWESIMPPDSPMSRNIGAHRSGTGNLKDGKYQYQSKTTGGTGVFILHEEGGRRVLIGTSDNGKMKAELTPAKD